MKTPRKIPETHEQVTFLRRKRKSRLDRMAGYDGTAKKPAPSGFVINRASSGRPPLD